MSSGATAVPELVFKIARASVYTELEPPTTEVATAEMGIVTQSFGPTQIILQNARVKGTLQTGMPYDIAAVTPHNFNAQDVHYIGKLENGSLLFRAPLTKT